LEGGESVVCDEVGAGFSHPLEDGPQEDVAGAPRRHTQPLAPLLSICSRRGIQLQVPTVVGAKIALATLQALEQQIGTKRDYY
jgi:hypothetical protein